MDKNAIMKQLDNSPETPRLEIRRYLSRYVCSDFEYHNSIGDDLYIFHKDFCIFPTKAIEELVEKTLASKDKKTGLTVMAQRTMQDEAYSHFEDFDKNHNRGQGPMVTNIDIAVQLDLNGDTPIFSLNYLPLED